MNTIRATLCLLYSCGNFKQVERRPSSSPEKLQQIAPSQPPVVKATTGASVLCPIYVNDPSLMYHHSMLKLMYLISSKLLPWSYSQRVHENRIHLHQPRQLCVMSVVKGFDVQYLAIFTSECSIAREELSPDIVVQELHGLVAKLGHSFVRRAFNNYACYLIMPEGGSLLNNQIEGGCPLSS